VIAMMRCSTPFGQQPQLDVALASRDTLARSSCGDLGSPIVLAPGRSLAPAGGQAGHELHRLGVVAELDQADQGVHLFAKLV